MNQPTIEQFKALQNQYHSLAQKVERLEKLEFTIRDSAVKIGIAEGLAKSNHEAISKFELKLVEVEASIKELREVSNQQFENIHQKLDRQEIATKENSDSLRQQSDMLRQILAKLQ